MARAGSRFASLDAAVRFADSARTSSESALATWLPRELEMRISTIVILVAACGLLVRTALKRLQDPAHVEQDMCAEQ